MFDIYIRFFDNKTYVGAYILIMISICVISFLIMSIRNKMANKNFANNILDVLLGINVVMFFLFAPYLFYITQSMFGLFFTVVITMLYIAFSVIILVKAYQRKLANNSLM